MFIILFLFWKENHFTAAGGTVSPRGSLWNRLILSRSIYDYCVIEIQAALFSGRNFGARLKNSVAAVWSLIDNMECQINHSPSVNWFDRRKCNFHAEKLCVTCQSRQRNCRKARKQLIYILWYKDLYSV